MQRVIYRATAPAAVSKFGDFTPISQYQLNQYAQMQITSNVNTFILNTTSTDIFIASQFNMITINNALYGANVSTLSYSYSDENDFTYLCGQVEGYQLNEYNIPGATATSSTGFVVILNSLYQVRSALFFIPTSPANPAPLITGIRLLRNTLFGNRILITFQYSYAFTIYSTITQTTIQTVAAPIAASIGIVILEYTTHTLTSFAIPTAQVGPVYIQGGESYATPFEYYSPSKINLAFVATFNAVMATIRLPSGSSMTWLGQSISNGSANPTVSLWVVDYFGTFNRKSPQQTVDFFYNIDTDSVENGYALIGAESTQSFMSKSLSYFGSSQLLWLVSFDSNTWLGNAAIPVMQPTGTNSWTGLYLPLELKSLQYTRESYIFCPQTLGNIQCGNVFMTTEYTDFLVSTHVSFDGTAMTTNILDWNSGPNAIISTQIDQFGNQLFDGTFYDMLLPAPFGAINNSGTAALLTMIIDVNGTVQSFNNISMGNLAVQSYFGISTVNTNSNYFSIKSVIGNSTPISINGRTISQPADGNTYTNVFMMEFGIVYV